MQQPRRRRFGRRLGRKLLWAAALGFGALNAVVALHAWRFTHFSAEAGPRTLDPAKISTGQKVKLLFTGIANPKPAGTGVPGFPYENITLHGPNGRLAAWFGPQAAPQAAPQTAARGVVVLCHGYAADKSKLRYEAAYFRQLGYAVLLFDFGGNGASEGDRCTIGYREAADVVAAFEYAQTRLPGRPVVLYGVSMGAVAILRAEAELGLRPAANVLECPYGSMLQTTRNRFTAMGVPAFPLANMLVFWGGVENNYWAFGLNSEAYARRVPTPTLLLWGTADLRVTRAEMDRIFAHLAGPKRRVDFRGLGHEPYWHRQPGPWRGAVGGWLGAVLP